MLGKRLGVADVEPDDFIAAMGSLGERQDAIQRRLAKRWIAEGSLVLFDLTSTHFEGACFPWPSAATAATSKAKCSGSNSTRSATPTPALWQQAAKPFPGKGILSMFHHHCGLGIGSWQVACSEREHRLILSIWA